VSVPHALTRSSIFRVDTRASTAPPKAARTTADRRHSKSSPGRRPGTTSASGSGWGWPLVRWTDKGPAPPRRHAERRVDGAGALPLTAAPSAGRDKGHAICARDRSFTMSKKARRVCTKGEQETCIRDCAVKDLGPAQEISYGQSSPAHVSKTRPIRRGMCCWGRSPQLQGGGLITSSPAGALCLAAASAEDLKRDLARAVRRTSAMPAPSLSHERTSDEL
jgi:hypothetical protein